MRGGAGSGGLKNLFAFATRCRAAVIQLDGFVVALLAMTGEPPGQKSIAFIGPIWTSKRS
jgi:hypothetical protein